MAGVAGKSGGKRAGAGRKSKAYEDDFQKLLAQAWKKADRKLVIEKLVDRAKVGNMEAIKLLLAYAYGKPVERREGIDEDDGLSDGSDVLITNAERAARIVALVDEARARRDRQASGD